MYIANIVGSLTNVKLDHKTSQKAFFIETSTSYEICISKLSIDVCFVRI